MVYLWVALGGAFGSVARFWLGNVMVAAFGSAFPWGTLLINVLGSFVISCFGAFATGFRGGPLPYEARIFVTVGLCGGFTTFSSFSLQTVELLRAGAIGRAAAYVVSSIVFCLVACAFGFWAAGQLPGNDSPAGMR